MSYAASNKGKAAENQWNSSSDQARLTASQAAQMQVESPIVARMIGDGRKPLTWRGVEQLEDRMLMSVSMNEGGWTVVTPEEDSRIIYVSSSRGNDGNSGLSENQAVKSLAHAKSLVRDNSADQILLRRGDVWYEAFGQWSKSGRSADAPIVIGAYGNSSERPELRTGFENGLWTSFRDTIDNVAIIGVHFYAHKRDPDGGHFAGTNYAEGIRWRASGENLLIEDVKIESYGMNLMMQSNTTYHNFDLRRSVIVDAYSASGHSHGMYIEYFDDITVEDNLFDHNGWNPNVNGANATIFNHNIYFQVNNSPVVARNNVFARGSATGIQMRSGGIAENNLFIANPTGMDFGFVIGAASPDPNGTSGRVKDNVFMYGTDIAAHQPRGMGLKIGNIGQLEVDNNLFVDDQSDRPYGWAMSLEGENGIGIKNLNIHDNTTYNWRGGIQVRPGTYRNVTIENNTLQQLDGQTTLMYVKDDGTLRHFDIDQNDYYSTRGSSSQFRLENSHMSFNDWKSRTGDGSEIRQVDFHDETRNAENYSRSYGGSASVDGFLRLFRENSRASWNTAFTAESFNEYMRQGFDMSEAPDDTRPLVSVAAAAGASETGNRGRFTFTRTGDLSKVLDVNYTVGGTATNGVDYQTLNGSIRFEAGQSTVTIEIDAIDDTLSEGTETVSLTLASSTDYRSGAARSATIDIADDDGGGGGNPTGNAEIVVTDSSADPNNLLLGLATTEVGQSSFTEHFEITNTGDADLDISNFALGGDAANDFIINVIDAGGNTVTGTNFTIGAGESYRIEVTFVPTNHGARVAEITFDTNDLTGGEESMTLQVAGEGTPADEPTGTPEIDISDSTGDPRNGLLGLATTVVGETSFPGTFVLTNQGTDVLLVTDLELTGDAAGDFEFEILDANGGVVTGDFSVDVGEAYTINVYFKPTQAGNRVANIAFNTNDLTDGESSISLQVAGLGEAAPTPQYSITDTSADPNNRTLGLATTDVGAVSYPGQYVIRNTGEVALDISQFGLTGDGASDYLIEIVGHNGRPITADHFTIAAGQSVTINVRFAPTVAGSRVANIEFLTNDPAMNGQPIQLKVAGLATGGSQAEIDITDSTNDPNNLTLGLPTTEIGQTSRVERFTIKNAGDSVLSITDLELVGAAASDFDIVIRDQNGNIYSGNDFNVAAGDSWLIEVAFNPTAAGDRIANITFNTNDATDGEDAISLQVAGLATEPIERGPSVGILGGPSDEPNPRNGGGVNTDIMPQGRFDANSPLTIKDANGNDVTFTIVGHGYGEAVAGEYGFASLVLHNTTSETQVLITTHGGSETAITNITVNGSLDRLEAKTTDLYGEMLVTGSINDVHLDDTLGAENRITVRHLQTSGSAMNVRIDEANNLDVVTAGDIGKAVMNDVRNSSWHVDGNVNTLKIDGQAEQFELVINGNARSIKLGAAASANVTAGGKIGSIQADNWSAGRLDADRIGALRTARANGDFGADVNVSNNDGRNAIRVIDLGGGASGEWDINGDIRNVSMQTTTDTWSADVDGHIGVLNVRGDASGELAAQSIGRMNVGGDMDGLDLELTGSERNASLRKMNVGGAVNDSTVDAAGAIGKIEAASLRDSTIASGLLADGTFDAISSIDRLTIKGDDNAVENSVVEARSIVNLRAASAQLADVAGGLNARAEQIDRLEIGDGVDGSTVLENLVNAEVRLI